MPPFSKIEVFLPGLRVARTYRREWFPSDLLAGLSVAAVALPIAIAYANLAGFPPVVGIYSAILPAVAYALFGSSRQLIVNPDAAACAIVASTVAPLAAVNSERYADLALLLTILTGLFCIAGGILGLGVIANFLSRPILTGYLNGIALSIIAGQLGVFLGFKIPQAGFFRTLFDVGSRIGETHLASLFLALALLVMLLALKRYLPRVPAPLIAAAAGVAAVYALSLDARGVAVVGTVPAGFLPPRIPAIHSGELGPLAAGAAGIMLVSFCSMMTTARGFATKNGYSIAVNQDMIALGVCDLASAFNRGFVVSGADSRTAVADSAGGKTQATSVVAALAMAAVLLFLTPLLAGMPTVALAAILISSAMGLFDIASLRSYRNINKQEFRLSVVAMLGVMTVGVLQGVLIAVGLSFIRLLRLASRPHDAVLGIVSDANGVRSAVVAAGGQTIPGLIVYRFSASLLFFNADYFRTRTRALIAAEPEQPRWFILDAESIPLLDITGAAVLEEFRSELAGQGVVLAIARASGLFQMMLERSGVARAVGNEYLFPTVHAGTQAFLSTCENAAQSKAG
jgi:high affinity sulfate transporter 1